MSKLHSLKKNLKNSRVSLAKFVAEQQKEKGINKFLGRRSLRKQVKPVEEKKEEPKNDLPDGLTFRQETYTTPYV